jgi:hypothetical protein
MGTMAAAGFDAWGPIGKAANLLQIEGATVLSLLGVLVIVLLIEFLQRVPWRYSWHWRSWRADGLAVWWSHWRLPVGWAIPLTLALSLWSLFAFTDIGSPNLARNGRLSEGLKFWGSGYIELTILNGNVHPGARVGLPFLRIGLDQRVGLDGALDTAERRPGRRASLRLSYRGPVLDHHHVSISQIIPVRQYGYYRPSFWVKSSGAERHEGDSLFLSLNSNWALYQCRAPSGAYEWQLIECDDFNVGTADIVEFRFVVHAPGKFWISDAALYELRGR